MPRTGLLPTLGFIFCGIASAQYSRDTTVINGLPSYVPTAGTTLPVRTVPGAALATPTLVYNCDHMPLICENVAAWSRQVNNSPDLPGGQAVFIYDGDSARKSGRRDTVCPSSNSAVFDRDTCIGAVSDGKQQGTLIATIAGAKIPQGITPQNQQVLINKDGLVKPRFWSDGTVFSCDEFPAATWVEGGSFGGQSAKTICALISWKTYRGSYPGLAAGVNQEQDFQGRSHAALRTVLNRLVAAPNAGNGGVIPFFLSTTTMLNAPSSKAWIEANGAVATVISKRSFEEREALATSTPQPVRSRHFRRQADDDDEPPYDDVEDGDPELTVADTTAEQFQILTVESDTPVGNVVCCFASQGCTIVAESGKLNATTQVGADLSVNWTVTAASPYVGSDYTVNSIGSCGE